MRSPARTSLLENKLYKKVRDTIETKLPWSATLIQMQMVYGFPKSLTILDAATRLATETGGVAYLCLSLGDADQIGDNFPVKEDFCRHCTNWHCTWCKKRFYGLRMENIFASLLALELSKIKALEFFMFAIATPTLLQINCPTYVF